MPLYEYVCRCCTHQFEELVFGGRVPRCPRCEAPDPERVMSVVSIGHASEGRERPAASPCGSCGDPRGPGACALR